MSCHINKKTKSGMKRFQRFLYIFLVLLQLNFVYSKRRLVESQKYKNFRFEAQDAMLLSTSDEPTEIPTTANPTTSIPSATTSPSISVSPSATPTTRKPTLKPTGPSAMPTQSPSLPSNQLNAPPACINDESEIAYVNGMISPTLTFYNCLANVPDSYLIPTLYNGTFNGIMIVNTSIQLNNLHEIDAVAGTATLDFYLRLVWQDNRLAMPIFWKKMSKSVQSNGIELTLILTNDSIGLWLPDVRFHDAAELDYIVDTIRINASNVVFWSRHTVATFMEPKFEFRGYPADTQCINIRYGSYAYNQNYFKMNYWGYPLTFNQNYDNSSTFLSNPIWTYDNSSTYYSTYVSSSGFLNAIFHIYVKRQGSGIVTRLILPITLLLILAGLTFWAAYEGRVDSTTTLLLSVSALYIVILSNIPLLGYLTAIDRYVFWMFLLLVLVVALHQSYSTMREKVDQWPLRLVYMRMIEFIGRVAIFPCVILYYLSQIEDQSTVTKNLMMSITLSITGIIFIREIYGIRKSMYLAMENLLKKINNEQIKINELSVVEIIFFNWWMFRKYTSSPLLMSEWLHKHGDFDNPNRTTIDLRHLYAIRESSISGMPPRDIVTLKEEKDMYGNSQKNAGDIMMTTFKSNAIHLTKQQQQQQSQGHSFQSNATTTATVTTNPMNNSSNSGNNNVGSSSLNKRVVAKSNHNSSNGGIRRSLDDIHDSDDES